MLSLIFLSLIGIAVACTELGSLSFRTRRADGWNYDRCDPAGPAGWGDNADYPLCPNSETTFLDQSPINVCSSARLSDDVGVGGMARWSPGYDAATTQQLTVVNNGGTVQFNVPPVTGVLPSEEAMYLEFAGLAATVGRAEAGTDDGADSPIPWALEQVHFHWGRSETEGSEHLYNGKHYPLEAHFVHHNTRRGLSVGAAVGTGKRDALLVVGVMFELGGDSAVLDQLADVATAASGTTSQAAEAIALSSLIDQQDGFFAYGGSLTTPTCNPTVTWVNQATPIKMSNVTLQKFLALSARPDAKDDRGDKISTMGNYRPLQPLGNRTVYYHGVTARNAACSATFDYSDPAGCVGGEGGGDGAVAAAAVSAVAALLAATGAVLV